MAREKGYTRKNFLKGLFVENPLLVSILGTCPALATTKSIEAAIGMGILFTIVLICSSCLVSLLRKIIPEEIRTPAYIVIIATFVTIVKMMTHAFLPELYSTLGVFISLIVVNCIVLGRAEAYASKNTVFDSLIDALGMGVGYTLAIVLMAFFREILGEGMITIGNIFTSIPNFSIPVLKYVKDGEVVYDFSISLFTTPAGAFIVFGLILAVIAFIKNRKAELKANLAKQEKARKAAEAAAQAAQAQAGGSK
ncbi:MAG: electron transport complex subunit RsxE [Bacilli bacterium]|nr:electron transport complex subunit RsxE [Bacilli bacterium]